MQQTVGNCGEQEASTLSKSHSHWITTHSLAPSKCPFGQECRQQSATYEHFQNGKKNKTKIFGTVTHRVRHRKAERDCERIFFVNLGAGDVWAGMWTAWFWDILIPDTGYVPWTFNGLWPPSLVLFTDVILRTSKHPDVFSILAFLWWGEKETGHDEEANYWN